MKAPPGARGSPAWQLEGIRARFEGALDCSRAELGTVGAESSPRGKREDGHHRCDGALQT